MTSAYKGVVYQAASGQWAWRIEDQDGELCGGGGYDEEETAEQDMNAHLADYLGADDAF